MIKTLSNPTQDKLARFNQEAEERDAQRRAVREKLPYLNLRTTPIEIEALKLLTETEAKELNMAAVNLINRDLIVAMESAEKTGVIEKIKELEKAGYRPKIFIVSKSSLNHAWSFYRYVPADLDDNYGQVKLSEEGINKSEKSVKTLQDLSALVAGVNFNTIKVTDFLEVILGGALALSASDIHFESGKDKSIIRFRLDGMLYAITEDSLGIPRNFIKRVIARLKLLANLKLNITDETQDGRFTIVAVKKAIEVRLAVAPSEYGEVAVMRVLDPKAIQVGVRELGFLEHDLKLIREQLKKPNGLLLNTGPTGSGKTTTLYAFLKEKSKPTLKVITIEDPIEYHLEGLEQTQVDEEAGYTFASGLRSLMRQDPDVILVGEIRDEETAKIAVDASLTGHLVFSTLHTNDAVGALPRLLDLGVRANVIGSALNLIIAQRLVRKLCDTCKELTEEKKNINIKKWLEKLPTSIDKNKIGEIKVFKTGEKSKTCQKCNGTGYKGRMGIFELLKADEDIQTMVEKQASLSEIKNKAIEKGMITMQTDGIIKVLKGLTSWEEVERVTGVINL